MEDILSDFVRSVASTPSSWEGEFHVGIGKASELSGLSESQIRYLEGLPGVNIGRRTGRNRQYTKHDIRLLKWVYEREDLRAGEIADFFGCHQEEILHALGHLTLHQVISYEQSLHGYDFLIAKLVDSLLSAWQRGLQNTMPDDDAPRVQGIIFAPQDKHWKTSFEHSFAEARATDLANCLVVWFDEPSSDLSTEPTVLFFHQICYLYFDDELSYDTRRFANDEDPFAIVILWRHIDRDEKCNRLTDSLPTHLLQPDNTLAALLMRGLKQALHRLSPEINSSVTTCSQTATKPSVVLRGLESFLDVCIQPYFSDCYSYIITLDQHRKPLVLAECGDPGAGYLPHVLGTDARLPWWIRFPIEQAGVALDHDVANPPTNVRGSAVCLPLVGIEDILGVLGIERTCDDDKTHILSERQGVSGIELLRYLLCITEIAAHWLTVVSSSTERNERVLAYTSDETVDWYWYIYQFGGWNYSSVVGEFMNWVAQTDVQPDDELYLILIDVAKEGKLARNHQGFRIVLDVVQRTKERVCTLLQNEDDVRTLFHDRHIMLFNEPVGDHLILAASNVSRAYLLTLLDPIRKFWKRDSGDGFEWEGKDADVSINVGICNFTGLLHYDEMTVARNLNFHLRTLAEQIYLMERSGKSIGQILEHHARIETIEV